MKTFKQLLTEVKKVNEKKELKEVTVAQKSLTTHKVERRKDDDLAARVFRSWTGT